MPHPIFTPEDPFLCTYLADWKGKRSRSATFPTLREFLAELERLGLDETCIAKVERTPLTPR